MFQSTSHDDTYLYMRKELVGHILSSPVKFKNKTASWAMWMWKIIPLNNSQAESTGIENNLYVGEPKGLTL